MSAVICGMYELTSVYVINLETKDWIIFSVCIEIKLARFQKYYWKNLSTTFILNEKETVVTNFRFEIQICINGFSILTRSNEIKLGIINKNRRLHTISHLKSNLCISFSAKRIYLFSKSRNSFFSGNFQEGKWDYSMYSILVFRDICHNSKFATMRKFTNGYSI